MKRALISVSNKEGIVEFAKQLSDLGVEIISTGGTYNLLKDENINAIPIDDITGFPEILDGRVKTLHPKVHGGILAIRDNPEHMKVLKEQEITPIDYIVVNLYPFKETILKDDTSLDIATENIDIGGPTMIRAGAKNYKYVSVITDPKDYNLIIDELKENKEISLEKRLYLANKAFNHTANYDALISNYLKDFSNMEMFPETLTLTYEKAQDLRYGENPQQKAAYYKEIRNTKGLLNNGKQIHGKELSFNNLNDANGALQLLKEFDEPTVVAVKHSNPCGVASGKDIKEAYLKAYESDTKSIYGGILACNREIDEDTAKEINKTFIEIIMAPKFNYKALSILSSKKNIRIIEIDDINTPVNKSDFKIKGIDGGLLIQENNTELFNKEELNFVTNRKPTDKELEDLIFTLKVVKHTNSNAIAIGKDNQTLGIGVGQVSRIWAANQGIDHANEFFKDGAKGGVLASDAFFPFPDCVEAAHKAGITAIIQPGGSINDQKSIDACNEFDIAMVLTGIRHFRH